MLFYLPMVLLHSRSKRKVTFLTPSTITAKLQDQHLKITETSQFRTALSQKQLQLQQKVKQMTRRTRYLQCSVQYKTYMKVAAIVLVDTRTGII